MGLKVEEYLRFNVPILVISPGPLAADLHTKSVYNGGTLQSHCVPMTEQGYITRYR